jgi:hypothetical protein
MTDLRALDDLLRAEDGDPGCRADHDGVLEAARRFGEEQPD